MRLIVSSLTQHLILDVPDVESTLYSRLSPRIASNRSWKALGDDARVGGLGTPGKDACMLLSVLGMDYKVCKPRSFYAALVIALPVVY